MSSLIRRDLQLKRQRRDRRKADQPERYLAKIVRLSGNMKVPNRPGYVYVQQLPDDDAPPPVPMLCRKVQPRVNMRVWVEKNREGRWEVVDHWSGIADQPGYTGYPYLPLHGRDHEWPDKAPRPDAVSVYPRALTMLRAYPGEAGGLTVSVAPMRYIVNGAVVFFPGQLSYDISASQPAAGLARYVGIYLDVATNAVGTVDGATTLDAPAIEPDMPVFPDGALTSAAVRLDADAMAFFERDFLDLRMVIGDSTVDSLAASSPGWIVNYNAVIPLGRDAFIPGTVSVLAGFTLTIDGELFIL
jgi:hypothetical protein